MRKIMAITALCMLVLVGWQWYNASKHPTVQPDTTVATDRHATPPSDVTSTHNDPAQTNADNTQTAQNPQKQPAQQTALAPDNAWHVKDNAHLPAEPIVIGQPTYSQGAYKAQIEFDPASASVATVRLAEFKLNASDQKTGYPLLAPCTDRNGNSLNTLQIGRLKFKNRRETFHLRKKCWETAGLAREDDGTASLTFIAHIVDHNDQPIADITKTYRYSPDLYDLTFSLGFVNHTTEPLQIDWLELYGPMGLLRENPRDDSRRKVIAAYASDQNEPSTKNVDLQKLENDKLAYMPLKHSEVDAMTWFAVSNKFFVSIVRPLPAPENGIDFLSVKMDESKERAEVFALNLLTDSPRGKKNRQAVPGAFVRLQTPKPIEPQAQTSFDFSLYLGPISHEIFAQPQYANLHYQKLFSSRSCTFCAFDWLRTLILKIMKGIYAVTRNYGIAIIILVLIVRLILHPVTKRSQMNMMKMGKLGPQMEELKKKYGDNKEEMSRRTMELYREHGIAGNMILGCLPMFLQMPIWIALYTAVDGNVALRHKGLFPAAFHWLTDLSAPDRLVPFSWFGSMQPISIPLVGDVDAFNLLPILLGLAMFLQTKYSSQASMAQANPQAAQQQKIMLYMMPVMMLAFFYSAPAGLNLYIMASTFAGLMEQRVIRKHLKEQQARDAQVKVATTAKVSDRFGGKKRKNRPPRKYFQ